MSPTSPEDLLFAGTHGWVAALNKFTGKEAWCTSLPKTGWSGGTLLHEDGVLFAATGGPLRRPSPASGGAAGTNRRGGPGPEPFLPRDAPPVPQRRRRAASADRAVAGAAGRELGRREQRHLTAARRPREKNDPGANRS